MDAASATDKIHARLTADLEADRAARVSAEPAAEPATEVADAIEIAAAAAVVEDAPAGIDAPVPGPSPSAQPQNMLEQPAILPEPANDREPIEPEEPKIYARGPEPTEVAVAAAATPPYAKADPAAVATPDRERFYEVGYRADLRNMIDHVIAIEGPIYFDVLIDRISRAHGFQRSGETVQKIIRAALGRSRFPTTDRKS